MTFAERILATPTNDHVAYFDTTMPTSSADTPTTPFAAKPAAFMFSWKEPIETGDGRSTVWFSPNIGLRFKFAGSRTVDINPTWLAALYASAASGRGLYPEPEPDRDAATELPAMAGAHVDWAADRPESPKTRAARPPGNA